MDSVAFGLITFYQFMPREALSSDGTRSNDVHSWHDWPGALPVRIGDEGSVGIGLILSCDTDAVVGEVCVHFRDEDFWHVAQGAVLCSGGASGPGMVRGCLRAQRVEVAT